MPKKISKVDSAKIDKKFIIDVMTKRQKATKLLKVVDIHPNKWNKNKMSSHEFAALKANIADPKIGFTIPILVRPHPEEKGQYEIVDGEHRWKAVKELNLDEVLAIDLSDLPDVIAKYLMLESNAVRGFTDNKVKQKLIQEIAEDPEWQKLMVDFDPYAGTVTDEPLDDADKYGMDDEDLDGEAEETVPQTLYFNPRQKEIWLRVIGQVRLARGVTAEQAIIECLEYFEKTTGLGVETGDESLDEEAAPIIKPPKRTKKQKSEAVAEEQ